METNVFLDEEVQPDVQNLSKVLGETYKYWNDIESYVAVKHPGVKQEWKNYGVKHGWSLKPFLKNEIYSFALHTISILELYLFSGIRQFPLLNKVICLKILLKN